MKPFPRRCSSRRGSSQAPGWLTARAVRRAAHPQNHRRSVFRAATAALDRLAETGAVSSSRVAMPGAMTRRVRGFNADDLLQKR